LENDVGVGFVFDVARAGGGVAHGLDDTDVARLRYG